MLTPQPPPKGFDQKEVFSSPTYEQLVSSPTYKLKTLLERKSRGMVSEIVVTHCDRLYRDLIYSPILQNPWFSSTKWPPTSTNFPKISLQSSKEEESPDENPKQGKKRKIRTTAARNKRQHLEALHRVLLIKVYPNRLQKQLLKRWMACRDTVCL